MNIDLNARDQDAMRLAQAQTAPVPESPTSLIHGEAAADNNPAEESGASSTLEMDTDQEDEGILWPELDPFEHACTTFAFDVPRQQLSRYITKPEENLPCLVAAAKKSRNEVRYNNLTGEEKKMFAQAKQKESKCWLDTNTVQLSSEIKSILHGLCHLDGFSRGRKAQHK